MAKPEVPKVNAQANSEVRNADRNIPEVSKEPVKKSRTCLWVTLGCIVAVLAALGIAGYFVYPRDTKPEVVSFNLTSGLTLNIKSSNLIDHTVNSLHIDVLYNGARVAVLEKKDFVIKKEATTNVTIPVVSVTPTKDFIKHCFTASSAPCQAQMTLDLALIGWTGKKININQNVGLPCTVVTDKMTGDERAMAKQDPEQAAEIGLKRLSDGTI